MRKGLTRWKGESGAGLEERVEAAEAVVSRAGEWWGGGGLGVGGVGVLSEGEGHSFGGEGEGEGEGGCTREWDREG